MRTASAGAGQATSAGRFPAALRIPHPFVVVVAVSVVLLLVGMLVSVVLGVTESVTLGTVLDVLQGRGSATEHTIVREIRIPRALVAALAGMSLATAGVLMQGITRNPLASPSIFGVTAGATFVVVASMAAIPAIGSLSMIAASMLGGAIGGGFVLLAGGIWRGETDQVRLPLAGVAITALLSSLTQAVVLFTRTTTEGLLYWMAGAVDGASTADVRLILPWGLAGLALAIWLARPLDILALGDDVAHNLGQRVARTRILASLGIIGLTGAAVAVAGPISFVGLIVPHIARRLIGSQHLRVIVVSAVLGAALLVYADIVARLVAWPYETPAGIITALIGGPYFLYLARRRGARA